MKGERKSPFQMRQHGMKGREAEMLIIMENKAKYISERIQFTQLIWKLKARRIEVIYFQMSLSKYFDKSSFIIIP